MLLHFGVLDPNHEHTRIAWELNLAGFRVLPPWTEDFAITRALVGEEQYLLSHTGYSFSNPLRLTRRGRTA